MGFQRSGIGGQPTYNYWSRQWKISPEDILRKNSTQKNIEKILQLSIDFKETRKSYYGKEIRDFIITRIQAYSKTRDNRKTPVDALLDYAVQSL
jgi:hypothetical protein